MLDLCLVGGNFYHFKNEGYLLEVFKMGFFLTELCLYMRTIFKFVWKYSPLLGFEPWTSPVASCRANHWAMTTWAWWISAQTFSRLNFTKCGWRAHCANIQDINMRCRKVKRKWQRTCVCRRRIVNFFIDSQVSLSGICGSVRICYRQQNRVITRNLGNKNICNYFNKPGQVFTCTDMVNLRSKMWAENF